MSKQNKKKEREYSEDFIDLAWYYEKSVQRGEITREEADENLSKLNPYKFKYNIHL